MREGGRGSKVREGVGEGGREGRREGGSEVREGWRERGREGEREGGREWGREGGKEGGSIKIMKTKSHQLAQHMYTSGDRIVISSYKSNTHTS